MNFVIRKENNDCLWQIQSNRNTNHDERMLVITYFTFATTVALVKFAYLLQVARSHTVEV
jgi:ActR/RegA family two-component response regulator